MQKYSRVFYLVGFLSMPLFILLLVFGYIKINQMASEEIHWGHNQSFAFGQASREGKLILLAVTKSRCEMLKGLECGEGKPDLGTYVLLNFTPRDNEFQTLILDDRFASLKKEALPQYFLLNSTGEIRHASNQLPSVEEMQKLPKKESTP
ncbi:hypothetical protein [Leptospira jelokensis]|uniref:Uncharacterized protein n=1 Tax=Leptospira jelokensis TaxID=2484931 RepID=A0A4Z0ZQQ6_9LEPT|nr:hypothetical protein [Leptospira jelokensis]TGL62437.1 hypothetical protein EHQ62_14025 [Leptospira jelokensis]TGM06631.1 hypothetical protein EHQ79_01340 [Leptospira jelokensis]